MPQVTMQVNLHALDTVGNVEDVIDLMGLDKDNEIVQAIITSVRDFQSQTALRRYLRDVGAEVIYLNLQFD